MASSAASEIASSTPRSRRNFPNSSPYSGASPKTSSPSRISLYLGSEIRRLAEILASVDSSSQRSSVASSKALRSLKCQ